MDPPLPGRRGLLVHGMLALATVLAAVAILAVWVNRQVFNAENWSNTSTELLANDDIRGQVAAYLVDQLYTNVDVVGELRQGLPPRLAPLAGPAANGLRNVAENGTNRLLERPRVQQAWKAANQVTAQQFINIAEGNSSAITASGSAVVLDMRVLLLDVAQRVGLSGKLVSKIPPGAARLKILDSDQVTTMQDASNILRRLAVVLPILSLGLFAGAVYLGVPRRRRILLWAGIDLIAAGVLVLVMRNLLGSHVVDTLATTDSVRPAAEAAWATGTGMLRDVAQATIIGAIPLVFAAWLAGPTRVATSARRALAPVLRDQVAVSYAGLATIIAIILAWGPIPATRKAIPVLIMIGLAILGLEVLRRQAAREFPEGTGGISLAALRPRRRSAEPNGARVQQLERLAALHDHGDLSDEEFAAEKESLLART